MIKPKINPEAPPSTVSHLLSTLLHTPLESWQKSWANMKTCTLRAPGLCKNVNNSPTLYWKIIPFVENNTTGKLHALHVGKEKRKSSEERPQYNTIH